MHFYFHKQTDQIVTAALAATVGSNDTLPQNIQTPFMLVYVPYPQPMTDHQEVQAALHNLITEYVIIIMIWNIK